MNRAFLAIATTFVVVGCGDAGSDNATAGADGSGGIPSAESDGDGGTPAPATSGADASQGGEGTDTSAGPDDTADAADANDGGDPPIVFDLLHIPDSPPPTGCGNGGGGVGGDLEFSYIWIANSGQNTVSKVNTQSLIEEGRYYTRPDSQGSPSRTSVGLAGDVAVANRTGGLTKYYAHPDNCVDLNGNGSIETSSGAVDILPWAAEECRAWHTPFTYTSQRPVAWTQGEWNPAQCAVENAKVWTTGVLNGTIEVVLVDGDTGVIEESVMVPEVAAGFFGFYGGAVDTDGNLWASQLGGGSLMRMNLNDLSDYSLWTQPAGGYGMTLGPSGYVFTCSSSVGRFDPATETWMTASVGGSTGCMEDNNGILWIAGSPVIGVDVNTLAVTYSYMLPNYVRGVSVDFDGYVWGVSQQTQAYKMDPATGLFDTVNGLTSPYTYSDMTGFALSSVGGGIPSG